MYSIASLHEFRRHLQLTETDTSADTDLRLALEKASHLIESLTAEALLPLTGDAQYDDRRGQSTRVDIA